MLLLLLLFPHSPHLAFSLYNNQPTSHCHRQPQPPNGGRFGNGENRKARATHRGGTLTHTHYQYCSVDWGTMDTHTQKRRPTTVDGRNIVAAAVTANVVAAVVVIAFLV